MPLSELEKNQLACKKYELEKKEKKRLAKKKYSENNKEKINEYSKKYRENNVEKEKKRRKKYKENNKEKIKEYNENNKDKAKKRQKKYDQSPKGIKSNTLSNWRRRGIIDPDLESVYNYFITQTNCWICDKEYNKDINMDKRCLDHDHDLIDEPNIRYICCNYCNLHIIK
tara:strand:- start:35 stop:544 length:510 start_codon:yes stop_codon:yes gene_type:complete